MRNKRRVAVLAVVAALALSAATVLAIKYGELDGEGHPYVG
jgi:hypothetical protein